MNKRERARVVKDLRKAAKAMANDPNACYLGCCAYIDDIDSLIEFECALMPIRAGTYWWPTDEEHRHVRVMALLFVAAAVEAGDWP